MMKVCELSGALLDYWVARAEGGKVKFSEDGSFAIKSGARFEPSARWTHGGPLIEKHRIGFGLYADEGREYYAVTGLNDAGGSARGSTHLIAACRAIIISKFGDEVFDA